METHKYKIRFGTGGNPLTTKQKKGESKTEAGLRRIKELGLEHLELEFVYSVYIKTEEEIESVRKYAQENNISLSAHGSYYTNLASPESKKFYASLTRLEKAAQTLEKLGGVSLTFHTGFYTGQTEEKVWERVLEAFSKYWEENSSLDITIAPETTGKKTQFSGAEDLVDLVAKLKKKHPKFPVSLCIDFAHLHARTAGNFNSEQKLRELFEMIRTKLGQEYLDNLHMHLSSINYGDKGEKNHLTLLGGNEDYRAEDLYLPELNEHYQTLEKKGKIGPGDLDWKMILRVLAEEGIGGFVVCESPNLEQDAQLMQRYYRELC